MRFNPKARIDQSQYEDATGSGGSNSRMSGLPISLGRGGLSIGTVVLGVVIYLVSQYVGGSGNTPTDTTQCQTGIDANNSDKCASALLATSVEDYWRKTFPQQVQDNPAYEPAVIKVFSGSTDSGCGQAASEMGPFYCPNDKKVYIDTNFMKDMLQGDLGAKGGPFALGYVVAHEYGHHVQDLLGYLGRIRTQQGPKSDSVKSELMADCLGGMWAKGAQDTVDADGNAIIEGLTQDDIANAIDAATAVGDDRIQQRSGGRVAQESWTHGSSEQRVHWFNVGLQQGSLRACDTFRAGAL